jgi:hypothetical protein
VDGALYFLCSREQRAPLSDKALKVLARSYVDLKFLPAEPDMSKLYTENFLPKR